MDRSRIRSLATWSAALILLDQLSKAWVRATLPVGVVYRPELALSQTVRLLHLKNYGGLGGFLENNGWIVSLLTLAVCAALVIYDLRAARLNRASHAGVILLIAGGLGNTLDRTLFGSVTDFISILSLPVMNLADLFVLAGLVMLILGIDEGDKRRKASPQAEASSAPPEETGG